MRKASRLREAWKKQGVPVPPIIIFSITNQCNLTCQGCYAKSLHPDPQDELDPARLKGIVEEAKELGISFFVLTGGEPFLRSKILDIARGVLEILFIVFTNGLLIDEPMIARFKKLKNIIPLLSLEGDASDTDGRRGEGTHAHVLSMMEPMRRNGIFFGTSLTLTRSNFSTMTDIQYVEDLVDKGCRFLLYVDYTPTQEGTEEWTLTETQRNEVPRLMVSFRSRLPALFIAVPWDEQQAGGCLSSGRGFVHINAQGDLEPCPFAPYSDVNLKNVSLKEALQSEFLETLRNMPDLSTYTGNGCALWKNREHVQSLLQG
jgi:MoaA/NifB/PqqE/SkfB family radical SAM enzyme